MTALVTGAGGMLGSALAPALVTAGWETVATDLCADDRPVWGTGGPPIQRLDVRERAEVEAAVRDVAPSIVFHLAAQTNLELCERDPRRAYATNTLGTKLVALACRRARIPMVYVSTAGVFDGAKLEAYDEFDAPNPVNVYGRSKLAGERVVRELVEDSFIVRAGWMLGGGRAKDTKFVSRVVAQVEAGVETVSVVRDQQGTPSSAPDFSAVLVDLVGTDYYGTFHLACEGVVTRVAVAREVLRLLGRERDVQVVEVDASFFADEFFAQRPASEALRNHMLELHGFPPMPRWDVALAAYLDRHFIPSDSYAAATIG